MFVSFVLFDVVQNHEDPVFAAVLICTSIILLLVLNRLVGQRMLFQKSERAQ